MKCPIEARENAELLLDCVRKLDPERTALLERHISSCAACRGFRDGQKLVWDALDQWEALPVTPDFDRRLYRRIEEEGRQSWWHRLTVPLSWRPVFPTAAAACLLVVGSFILRNPGGAPAPAESPQVYEIEQVERTLEDMEMLRQLKL